MLQMNMLQSQRTRDPINGAGQSDQAEGGSIDGPINFTAPITATTPYGISDAGC